MPSTIKAFGFGLALGTITGLLYAPKSGVETRAYVADKAGVVKNKAVGSASWVGNKASWVGNKTRQIVDAVRSPLSHDGQTTEMEIPVYQTIEYYIAAFPVEEEGERVTAQQERTATTRTQEAQKEVRILGPDGQEVGQLKGVLMDPSGNEVQYGVVALKDRKNEQELCAVPWSEMKETEEGNYQGNYSCALPQQNLEQSPKFTERELKNESRNRGIIDRIRSYYRRDSDRENREDQENR